MPRIIATVTPEVEQALMEIQRETNAPLASILRDALNEHLKRNGKTVSTGVKWGGKRNADSSRPRTKTA